MTSYSNPTSTAIRQRIRELLVALVDANGAKVMGTDISDGVNPLSLPAFTVVAGQGTWRANGSGRWIVTRTYEVWVFVTALKNVTNDVLIRDAFADCEPLIITLVDYFHRYPRLDSLSTHIPLVMDTDDISDSGAAQSPVLNGVIYAAFRILLPITTVAP